MNIFCLFGHDREYLALKEITLTEPCRIQNCCNNYTHEVRKIEVRWACKRCSKMSKDVLSSGAWTIEFGKLVPDKKAWANFKGAGDQVIK